MIKIAIESEGGKVSIDVQSEEECTITGILTAVTDALCSLLAHHHRDPLPNEFWNKQRQAMRDRTAGFQKEIDRVIQIDMPSGPKILTRI